MGILLLILMMLLLMLLMMLVGNLCGSTCSPNIGGEHIGHLGNIKMLWRVVRVVPGGQHIPLSTDFHIWPDDDVVVDVALFCDL